MKIVFMGTPEYAAASLEAVIQSGREVTLVVTQPDKPKGRSGELIPSPVKQCAIKHGIPVFQPERIKRAEAVEQLKQYEADLFVVAAFGQILSQEILDMPRLGSINVHASLLPKYRGASPIQRVLLDGEKKTGITIMQMDAGIDTGDILYQRELEIAPDDNFETLHDKLAVLGGEALAEALDLLEEGKLVRAKQDDSQSCYAPLITKEMGRLDFTKDAVSLDRQIRAMTPWPSAFTKWNGKQMKIWKASPVGDIGRNAAAGEVTEVTKDSFSVATGDGELCVEELQMEGKKRMSSHDFLLGIKLKPGDRLGE
ncbi:MAG: methionyl-tRNA formyltransferase [Lachnospiraceae bacterium]|nr:methionyl-tRNA formyltransferase [Lachnospiraceae bacterium]